MYLEDAEGEIMEARNNLAGAREELEKLMAALPDDVQAPATSSGQC